VGGNQALVDQQLGNLDMPEFKHLDLRNDARLVVLREDLPQEVRRRGVDHLPVIHRATVEAADVRPQVENVPHPINSANTVAVVGQARTVVQVKPQVAAHAAGVVENERAVGCAYPPVNLGKQVRIARRSPGLGVADVHVHDRRTGRRRGQRVVGNLRRRHGHMGVATHRIAGARQRTGDDDLAVHRLTSIPAPRRRSSSGCSCTA
jgi:hypothetical protein